MVFVGRERETAQMVRHLTAGGHVLVSGMLGIGRTSLVRHVAETMEKARRFHVLDLTKGPAAVCRELLRQLGLPHTSARGHPLSFVSARARVLRTAPAHHRRPVLVFDEVGRLTAPKLALLRSILLAGTYQVVAVLDSHASGDELTQLRVTLHPALVVQLHRLGPRSRVEYFTSVTRELGLDLVESEIGVLASTTGGYPLLMAEAAARLRRRREARRGMLVDPGAAPRDAVTCAATTPFGGRAR